MKQNNPTELLALPKFKIQVNMTLQTRMLFAIFAIFSYGGSLIMSCLEQKLCDEAVLCEVRLDFFSHL